MFGCSEHDIPGGEECPFRLFKVHRHSESASDETTESAFVEVDLELELLEGAESHGVEYVAISYSWEGQKLSVPVRCNGLPALLTPSMVELLSLPVICPTAENVSHFWCDQICIRQNDPSDKNRQIPLMYPIFLSAHIVLVWLGLSDVLVHEALERIRSICQAYKYRFREEQLQDIDFHRSWAYNIFHMGLYPGHEPLPELPSLNEMSFWRGMHLLLCRSWFSRVWTISKHMLARRCILSVGTTSIALPDLVLFQAMTPSKGDGTSVSVSSDLEEPSTHLPGANLWQTWLSSQIGDHPKQIA